MKDFFKYLLATILGIVCVGVFTGIISFVMLMAVVVAGSAKPEVAEGSVLRLRLTGTLSERATDDPMALFTGNPVMTEQGLDDMLAAIRVAKANPNIAGIYIEGGVLLPGTANDPSPKGETQQAVSIAAAFLARWMEE